MCDKKYDILLCKLRVCVNIRCAKLYLSRKYLFNVDS